MIDYKTTKTDALYWVDFDSADEILFITLVC